MLPKYYRVFVRNESDTAIPAGKILIHRIGWYYGAADDGTGRVAYEDTRTEIFALGASLAPDAVAVSNTVDNIDEGFLGAYFSVEFDSTGIGGTGNVQAYLQCAMLDADVWETGRGHLLAEFDSAVNGKQRALHEFEYAPLTDEDPNSGAPPAETP